MVPFFKKRNKKSSVRARRTGESSSDEEDEDVILGKGGLKRSGLSSVSKRTKRTDIIDRGDATFLGDRSATNRNVNDATKEIDVDGYDQAALLGRAGSTLADKDGASDGLYHGQAGYDKHRPAAKEYVNKKAQAGPVKAPTNIRAISVVDYQPDVCKDYKQTGFCGFGDTCKFLHDRGDYKQGWQLDRDWEDAAKRKKAGVVDELDSDEEESDEDDVPFACLICRSEYKNPIETKCGHFYCERCAIERYRKTPTCIACGAGTGGIFNVAKKLRARIDAKKKRIAERERAKVREEDAEDGIQFGGEDSDVA